MDHFLSAIDGLDPLYAVGRAAASGLLTAASIFDVVDLPALDVFRGYWQVVAVIFASIASPVLDTAAAFFGRLANVVTLNFTYLSDKVTPRTWLRVAVYCGNAYMIALFVFIAIMASFDREKLKTGHEGTTWTERRARSPRFVGFLSASLIVSVWLLRASQETHSTLTQTEVTTKLSKIKVLCFP